MTAPQPSDAPGTPEHPGTTGASGVPAASGTLSDLPRTVAVGEVVELADTDGRETVVAGRHLPLVYRPCTGDSDGDRVGGPVGEYDRDRVRGLVEYLRVRPEKVRAAVLWQADWPVALVRDRGLVCGVLVVDLAEKEATGPTVSLREMMDTPVDTVVALRQRYRALAQLCVLLDTFRKIGRDLVGLRVDQIRVGDRGRTVFLTGADTLEVGELLVTCVGPDAASPDGARHGGRTVLNRASFFAGLVVRVLAGHRDITATDVADLPPDVRFLLRRDLHHEGGTDTRTGDRAGDRIPDFLAWWPVLKTVATGVVRAPRQAVDPAPVQVTPPAPVVDLPEPRPSAVRQVLPGLVTVLGAALLVLGVLGLVGGAALWSQVMTGIAVVCLVGGVVTGVRGMRRRQAEQVDRARRRGELRAAPVSGDGPVRRLSPPPGRPSR